MALNYWKIDEAECVPCAVSVVSKSKSRAFAGVYRGFVKWDGCTNLWAEASDGNDPRGHALHFCELDEEIARWQELRALALAYFGGEFGVGCVCAETDPSSTLVPEAIEAALAASAGS